MQIKTECPNEKCGRALLIEDYAPGTTVPCPFCGLSFAPPPPSSDAKLVLPSGPSPVSRPPDALKRDLGLAADLRGAPKPAASRPSGERVIMKGPLTTKPAPPPQPPAPARNKAPNTMIAKAILVPPEPPKPGVPVLALPSETPTQPDPQGFEVVDDDDDTPMMAIPVNETPSAPAARPAAKPTQMRSPPKATPPLQSKPAAPRPAQPPAGAPPGVMKAILIEDDDEPVMDAVLINPPKPPGKRQS